MIDTAVSLLPVVADSVRNWVKAGKSAQKTSDRIRRALLVEMRCNLELLELLRHRRPNPNLVKEILSLLQLEVLQAVYGLEMEATLTLDNFDADIVEFLQSREDDLAKTYLPIDISRQPVSTALDYLLRKGVEMKAIAALSDKAVISFSKSINWRKRLDNYRRVLLFTINNLKTKSRKAKP